MDKTLAGLVGVGALALASPSHAAPVMPHANTYAELLAPIPNASAVLDAVDSQDSAEPAPSMVQEVQYHHHHHHHHHHWHRRWHRWHRPVVVIRPPV